jgi:ATP-dependent exoDNAse (exonuclease V) alpha subunit
MILFGDVLQLPPVIDLNNKDLKDYYDTNYSGNIMFFNSHFFKQLNFKKIVLRKSYRQADQEFADKLIEIGYRDHCQETLDYFNQRVMALPDYEKTHGQYIYVTPANVTVTRINNDYIKSLKGKSIVYHAEKSKDYPKDKALNDDTIEIKEGAQVMCVTNHRMEDSTFGYVNGTVGVVKELHPEYVVIESDGRDIKVGKTTSYVYKMIVDKNGNIEHQVAGWFKQIDCRVCRASTVHKTQGQTLDAAYMSLLNWVPPGIVYVGLSRVKTLAGLGLSRPLRDSDINISSEAFAYLEG